MVKAMTRQIHVPLMSREIINVRVFFMVGTNVKGDIVGVFFRKIFLAETKLMIVEGNRVKMSEYFGKDRFPEDFE